MRTNNKPCIIMALNTDYDKHFETDIIRQATGLESKPVQGFYKGSSEISHVIPYDGTYKQWDVIMSLARKYNQESVLCLTSDRRAHLQFTDSFKESIHLGTFTNVSQSEAIKHDSFTFDPDTGYWICIK